MYICPCMVNIFSALMYMTIICCVYSENGTVCSPRILCQEINVPIFIILLCRIFHLVLAIFMLIEYFLKTWPTFVFDVPVISRLLWVENQMFQHILNLLSSINYNYVQCKSCLCNSKWTRQILITHWFTTLDVLV